MTETPFFLTNGAYSLFAVLHEPAREPSGKSFVLCPPFFEEKLWAHRVFVSFARRLAEAGHTVLRLDYMGNGDSDGEFEASSVASAESDVRCAVNEVRRRSGTGAVTLVGLRFGATVASLVAEAFDDVDRLVLWAPIVDGERYMQEQLRMNVATQTAVYKEVRLDRAQLVESMRAGGTVNVDGYDMSYPLYAQAAALKLADAPKQFRGKCLIVQIERQPGRPAYELQQLAACYDDTTVAFAQEEPFWKEISHFYNEASELSKLTLEWLRDN